MTVAHLHLWAVCQSCIYPQEYYGEASYPIRDQTPVLKTSIKVVTGHIVVPAGLGLGVEVDEEMIRQSYREINNSLLRLKQANLSNRRYG